MVSTNDIEGVKVTVELEASDTLAVLLKSMRVEGAPKQTGAATLREQSRAIVDEITYLDGELALIEVDGTANAVQIRSRKPSPQENGVRFVEVVLRNGNLITVETKGASVHLSHENLGKLKDTLVKLV